MATPAAISYVFITLVCLTGAVVAETVFRVGAPSSTAAIAEASATATLMTSGVAAPREFDRANLAKVTSDIVSRPLFAHDRRPPTTKRDVPRAAATPEPVKLVGTIVSDGVRVAFLEIADKRVTRFLGDNVEDGRIVAIDASHVRVLADDGHMDDLRLTRGTVIEPPPHLEHSTRRFHLEE